MDFNGYDYYCVVLCIELFVNGNDCYVTLCTELFVNRNDCYVTRFFNGNH